MSRKRGKKKRAPEAVVAEEVLAEGSGPVTTEGAGPAAEPITADDIVTTTDDVMTPDDVVTTTDDVVAAEAASGDASDPAADLDTAVIGDAPGDEAPELAAAAATDDAPAEAALGDAPAEAALGDAPAEPLDEPPGDPIEPVAAAEVTETDDGDDGDVAAAALPTSALTMEPQQLKLLVEALIFASDKPMTVQRLRQLTRVSDTKRLEQALAELAEDYRERGLVLQQVSGGYQFRTRTQFSGWVQQLIAGRPVRLSRAQLETLAIIAYRQPITRPEIDDIRGVDSSATLKLLLDRSLIRVLGKREEVGRPMLYGTTKEFLDFFSLGDLRELPTLREYSELSAESRQVMSDRLGIELDDSGGEGEGGGGGGGSDGGGGSGGGGGGGSGGGGSGGGGPSGTDGGPGSASGFDPDAGGSPDTSPDRSASALSDALADYLAAADAVDRSDAAALASDAHDSHDIAAAADDSAESQSIDDSPELGAAADSTDADAMASGAIDASHDIAATADDSAESQSIDDPLDVAAAADSTAPDSAAPDTTATGAVDTDSAAPDAMAADAMAADAMTADAMRADAIAAAATDDPHDIAATADDSAESQPTDDPVELAAAADATGAGATSDGAIDEAHDIAAPGNDSAESPAMNGSLEVAALADTIAPDAMVDAIAADAMAADAMTAHAIDDSRDTAGPADDSAESHPTDDSVDLPITAGATDADAIAADAADAADDSAESSDDPTWGERVPDIDTLAAVARRVMARAGAPEQVVDGDSGWPAGSQRFTAIEGGEPATDEAARSVAADGHAIGAVVLDEQHAAGAAEEPAEPTHE